MKVYVNRIPDEGMTLESEEPASIMELEEGQETFPEPILVKIKVFKVSGNLLVTGVLTTHVDVICSRCSERFLYLIEDKRFQYDCPVEEHDIIDLTGPIREDIIIGLPIRPICKPDCKGLCSQCGQNLNVKACACKVRGQQKGPFSVLDNYFEAH